MTSDRAREAVARAIEEAVGGAYSMPDGRKFWIDAPVAREVTQRAIAAMQPTLAAAFADGAEAMRREAVKFLNDYVTATDQDDEGLIDAIAALPLPAREAE